MSMKPQWKMTLHMSCTDHYEMHYRCDELGISACRITPRINEFECGKPKLYFVVDGIKRTYRKQDAAIRAAKARQKATS